MIPEPALYGLLDIATKGGLSKAPHILKDAKIFLEIDMRTYSDTEIGNLPLFVHI